MPASSACSSTEHLSVIQNHTRTRMQQFNKHFSGLQYARYGWLGSRVVSVLDSGAEDLGSNRSREAVA